jgi:hypothetical protein
MLLGAELSGVRSDFVAKIEDDCDCVVVAGFLVCEMLLYAH